MEEKMPSLFREKALRRISSPEQLSDYLRVTQPGVWLVLAAVILLLAGLCAWSAVGTLETTAAARVLVKDQTAQIVLMGGETEALRVGAPFRVAEGEYPIASAETDVFGRTVGLAEVPLPDGLYDGVVVTGRTRPITFLLESG